MRALTLCGCIVLTGVLAALPSRIERATIVTPAMSRGASTSDSVDARTRAALLASRDAIWRAWFANDTAALARLLPRSTTAGEQRGCHHEAGSINRPQHRLQIRLDHECSSHAEDRTERKADGGDNVQ